MARHPKNIWVAAGDGDIHRVRELMDNPDLALSPNVPDQFTYTPMHAAASYGHIQVLDFLISRGGNVNIADGDGDTPLYTVEDLETARFLVQHGAVVARHNNEGISPIDHLNDEYPHISDYLRSTLDPSALPTTQPATLPSQHSQDAASEQLTSSLISSAQEIMEQAQTEGRDPEEELRQVVSRTVLEGVLTGFEMSTDSSTEDDSPSKRPKNK